MKTHTVINALTGALGTLVGQPAVVAAEPNEDPNWKPSMPDYIKAVEDVIMRNGDEFDICAWQEIKKRLSVIEQSVNQLTNIETELAELKAWLRGES